MRGRADPHRLACECKRYDLSWAITAVSKWHRRLRVRAGALSALYSFMNDRTTRGRCSQPPAGLAAGRTSPAQETRCSFHILVTPGQGSRRTEQFFPFAVVPFAFCLKAAFVLLHGRPFDLLTLGAAFLAEGPQARLYVCITHGPGLHAVQAAHTGPCRASVPAPALSATRMPSCLPPSMPRWLSGEMRCGAAVTVAGQRPGPVGAAAKA